MLDDNEQQQAPAQQWLIVGPPGVGKTTDIQRQATNAATKFGNDKVLLSSFTKAATAELVSRDTPIEQSMIGTLHSFAYHALGRPDIAEAKIKDWNADKRRGDYHLTSSLDMDEPESGGKTPGDELYSQAQILRARMVPYERWPSLVRDFHDDWCDFKRESNTFDFTDLIEMALQDVDYAPGNPTVGFFDEHQDVSKLEHALVAKWGSVMDYFFLTGDPDQALYTFKGSDPDIFLDPPTPRERTRLLTQSHRVPRQVYIVARRWIETLSRRYPSNYQPRAFEGKVEQNHGLTFKDAERVIGHAERDLADGKEIMFLGACGFHVSPIIQALRNQGIPFHNPNRRRRGDWNPLGKTRGLSTVERVRAFLEGDAKYWTVSELQSWIPLLAAKGVLVHGGKKAVEGMTGGGEVKEDVLAKIFGDEKHLRAALNRDVGWMRANLANKTAGNASYALTVIERRGLDALKNEPRVIVGTVHSVKGDEADTVYLDPSMSPSMLREWYNPNRRMRDPIIRQYYVGLTRAKEKVVVVNSTSAMVDIDCSVPKQVVEEI